MVPLPPPPPTTDSEPPNPIGGAFRFVSGLSVSRPFSPQTPLWHILFVSHHMFCPRLDIYVRPLVVIACSFIIQGLNPLPSSLLTNCLQLQFTRASPTGAIPFVYSLCSVPNPLNLTGFCQLAGGCACPGFRGPPLTTRFDRVLFALTAPSNSPSQSLQPTQSAHFLRGTSISGTPLLVFGGCRVVPLASYAPYLGYTSIRPHFFFATTWPGSLCRNLSGLSSPLPTNHVAVADPCFFIGVRPRSHPFPSPPPVWLRIALILDPAHPPLPTELPLYRPFPYCAPLLVAVFFCASCVGSRPFFVSAPQVLDLAEACCSRAGLSFPLQSVSLFSPPPSIASTPRRMRYRSFYSRTRALVSAGDCLDSSLIHPHRSSPCNPLRVCYFSWSPLSFCHTCFWWTV